MHADMKRWRRKKTVNTEPRKSDEGVVQCNQLLRLFDVITQQSQ